MIIIEDICFVLGLFQIQLFVVVDMVVVDVLIWCWLFLDVVLINQIVDYIIFVGGKCLCLMLVMLVGYVVGQVGLEYYQLVVIIEFIYIFILLYDDVVDEFSL